MSEFKNMKIPVENNLREIVEELDRKGYWFNMDDGDNRFAKWIILVLPSGRYDIYNDDRHIGDWAETITLNELKEMQL